MPLQNNFEQSMRSIRKVLAEALKSSCESASILTGKSINALPEFFLAVKVAEYVNEHFSTFTFSMEDRMIHICNEVGIDYKKADSEFRINKLARADLVLKSKKSKKIKHVIEFKRNIKASQIRKDALRLAWLCASAPPGHKLEKNFLVVVSQLDPKVLDKRTFDISTLVEEISPYITVKFESVDLSQYQSTRSKGQGKQLSGGVWEFSYSQ